MREFAAEDFRKEIARERRASMAVAKAFAKAAEVGDVEAFYQAVDMMQFAMEGWRLAFKKVAKLPAGSEGPGWGAVWGVTSRGRGPRGRVRGR